MLDNRVDWICINIVSRSRSEFLREAARAYIQKKERWNDIFALGRHVVEKGELTLDSIAEEIAAYRKTKGSGIC